MLFVCMCMCLVNGMCVCVWVMCTVCVCIHRWDDTRMSHDQTYTCISCATQYIVCSVALCVALFQGNSPLPPWRETWWRLRIHCSCNILEIRISPRIKYTYKVWGGGRGRRDLVPTPQPNSLFLPPSSDLVAYTQASSLLLASFTGRVEGGGKWPENLQEFLRD